MVGPFGVMTAVGIEVVIEIGADGQERTLLPAYTTCTVYTFVLATAPDVIV